MDEINSLSPSCSTTLVLRPQLSNVQVVHLKKKKPKHISWDVHVIDNENLNRKRSNCCCIYEKPKIFGNPDGNESDSDYDDCCDSCMGKKKTHQLHGHANTKEEQNDEPKVDN